MDWRKPERCCNYLIFSFSERDWTSGLSFFTMRPVCGMLFTDEFTDFQIAQIRILFSERRPLEFKGQMRHIRPCLYTIFNFLRGEFMHGKNIASEREIIKIFPSS